MSDARMIVRAIEHAGDMNQNGRLTDDEVIEFMRFTVSEIVNELPASQYAELRRDGDLECVKKAAGYDEHQDPDDAWKNRKSIADKVSADLALADFYRDNPDRAELPNVDSRTGPDDMKEYAAWRKGPQRKENQ